jgi:hypothetical protein
MRLLEAGLVNADNAPAPIVYLSAGEYQKAFDAITPADQTAYPWLKDYLTGLLRDIAAGKETLGDTTTLEDLSVLAKLRADSGEDE